MKLENYIQAAGVLFEAVQNAAIFLDEKTFLDSCPNSSPEEILKRYLVEKEKPKFDLKTFIFEHFEIPDSYVPKSREKQTMEAYIQSLWFVLDKEMTDISHLSTLIRLPNPHIVPGGRFRECFYWDSYFTALGLAASKHTKQIKNMVENFAYLINRFGLIPNGNRIYFLSRSQPPYFSLLLELLYEMGHHEWVLSFFPALEKEYLYWMGGNTAVKIDSDFTLNRYYDDLDIPRPEAFRRETLLAGDNPPPQFFRNLRTACATGWDFSSRWLEDPKDFKSICALDILPVDLNCLLYHLEKTLSNFAKELRNPKKEKYYREAAEKRKKAIEIFFWDEEKQFYFDYNYLTKSQTDSWTLAGVTPLFFHLPTQAQANSVTKHLEKDFLLAGGFTTSFFEGFHQWDMPNGWAPLQWITTKGLLNYGKEELAKEGAKRWINLCEKLFLETGTLHEKYNVRDCSIQVTRGEYELQEGFGWTNGVVLALKALF